MSAFDEGMYVTAGRGHASAGRVAHIHLPHDLEDDIELVLVVLACGAARASDAASGWIQSKAQASCSKQTSASMQSGCHLMARRPPHHRHPS